MIKATTVFFLDLVVAAIASKLIDLFWGNQPQVTPAIIFVIVGGILIVYFQNDRELALTWGLHRFMFLFNARDQYRRMLEIKSGKNAKVFGSSSTESYLRITNGKHEDDFSNFCYLRIINSKDRQKILITGNPGSGKSFGLIKTAQAIAQFSIYKLGFATPIPVLIRCDEYKGNLAELLKNKLPTMSKGESGKILGKGIDKLLREGKILILLDAIDETPKEYKPSLMTEIENISSSPAYEDCSIILTGRQFDIDLLKFEKLGFDIFEIKDLTDSGVNHFISIYKQENQILEDIAETLKNNNLLSDNGLGRNAFWLSLMVEQNIFGADYVVILDKSINKLMQDELDKPKTPNRWEKNLPIELQINETRLALSALAFDMVRNEKTTFEFDETKALIDKFIKARDQKKLSAYDVIGLAQDSHILETTRFTSGKQYPVRFRHPLLRDFMAACYVLDERIIENDLESISKKIKQWQYVLFFSLNLLQDYKSPWFSVKRHKKAIETLTGKESDVIVVLMIASSMSVFEKYVEKEFYELVITRLEHIFNNGFSQELEQAILNVLTIAPEYFVETINDIADRKNVANISVSINFLLAESIKTGHKSRLLIHLLDQLKLRELVVTELIRIGIAAANPLVEIIESEKDYSKWDKLQIESDDKEERERTRKWEIAWRKTTALSALVKIDTQRATPFLEKLLSTSDPLGKEKIIKLIGDTNDSKFIPLLLSELRKDNHPYDFGIRIEIYEALSKMGDEGLNALLELIKKNNFFETSMYHLDDAIASFGAQAIEGVKRLLKSKNKDVLHSTVVVINKIKDPILLPDLMELFEDWTIELGIDIAKTIASFGEIAIPHLIELSNSEEFERQLVNSFIADELSKTLSVNRIEH